jgi:hypothetical protein
MATSAEYVPVARFDVSDRVSALGEFPGWRYLQFDAVLTILHHGPMPNERDAKP